MCKSEALKFNKMYTNYGKNSKNVICLCLGMQFFSDAEMIRTYRDTLKVEFPLISEAGANKKLWDVVVGHFPGAMPRLGLVRPSDKEILINTRSTTELEAKMTEVIGNTGTIPESNLPLARGNPVSITGGYRCITVTLTAAADFSIVVRTNSGRQVWNGAFRTQSAGRWAIPVQGLSQGIYLITVQTQRARSISKISVVR